MKIGDTVVLMKTTIHYSRGVVGRTYTIADILKTEVKLCTENSHCFYTHPDNVMSSSVTDSTYTGSDYDIDKPQTESEVFATNLDAILKEISDLLKSKNKSYGNSALKPAKIFSQLDATESLCSRIDDKLARIGNKGINDETEDTVDDLIGYLLLLKMSMEK
jgi:hypothetical protein